MSKPLEFQEDDEIDGFQAWGEEDEDQELELDTSLDEEEPVRANEQQELNLNDDYDLNEDIQVQQEQEEPDLAEDNTEDSAEEGEDTLASIASKLQRIQLYLPELSSEDTLYEQLQSQDSQAQAKKRSFKELSQIQLKTDQLNKELQTLNSMWFISQLIQEIRLNLSLWEFESVFHSLSKLQSKISEFDTTNDQAEEISEKYQELETLSMRQLNDILIKFITITDSSLELRRSIVIQEEGEDRIQLNLSELYQDVIIPYQLEGKLSLDLVKLISGHIVERLIDDQHLITSAPTSDSSSVSLTLIKQSDTHVSIQDQLNSLYCTLQMIDSFPSPLKQRAVQFNQSAIKKHILANIIKPQAANILSFEELRSDLLQLDQKLLDSNFKFSTLEGVKYWVQDDELALMIEESKYESVFEQLRTTVLNFNGFDQLVEREVQTLTPAVASLAKPVEIKPGPSLSRKDKRRSVIKVDSNGDQFEEEEWGDWDESEDELGSLELSPVKKKVVKSPRSASDKTNSNKKKQNRLSLLIKGEDGQDEDQQEEWDAWGAEEEPLELDLDEQEPLKGINEGADPEEEWDAWGEQEENLSDLEDTSVQRLSSEPTEPVATPAATTKTETYKSSKLPEQLFSVLNDSKIANPEHLHNLVSALKLFLLNVKSVDVWQVHNEFRSLAMLLHPSNPQLSQLLQHECSNIIRDQLSQLQSQIHQVVSLKLFSFSPDLIKDQLQSTLSLTPLLHSLRSLLTDLQSTLPESESIQLTNRLTTQWYEFLIDLVLTSRQEIGEEESHNLSHILNFILDFKITPATSTSASPCPSEHRLSNVTQILTSHLSDIMTSFYDGDLYDLSTEELVRLIELLFVQSEVRERCLGEIKEVREGF